jgi:hypothetical protein
MKESYFTQGITIASRIKCNLYFMFSNEEVIDCLFKETSTRNIFEGNFWKSFSILKPGYFAYIKPPDEFEKDQSFKKTIIEILLTLD